MRFVPKTLICAAAAVAGVTSLLGTPAMAAEGCVRLVNQGTKSVPGHVMMQSREWTTFRLSAGETKIVCVKGAEMFPDNQLYLVLKGGLGSPLFDCRITARNEIQIIEIKMPDGSTRPRAECK